MIETSRLDQNEACICGYLLTLKRPCQGQQCLLAPKVEYFGCMSQNFKLVQFVLNLVRVKVKVKVKDISRSRSRSKVIQGQILQVKGSDFQVTLSWSRSRSKWRSRSNLRSRSWWLKRSNPHKQPYLSTQRGYRCQLEIIGQYNSRPTRLTMNDLSKVKIVKSGPLQKVWHFETRNCFVRFWQVTAQTLSKITYHDRW